MTKRTVTNGNGRTVVTEGTKDFAVATAPDVLLDPKKKKKQFNNWIEVEEGKLHGGTSPATTVGGKSIWILQALVGPPSFHTPPPAKTRHGPGFLGTVSAAPADGPAEAVSGSTNLKAEGEPVIRVKDPTWQNDRNTTGEVMTQVKLLDLKEDGGDEGGGGARARGPGGRIQKPSGGQRQRGGPLLPPSGTEPVDSCAVLEIAAACSHDRPTRNGFLQLVTKHGDNVRVEARVNGPCGREHPVWDVSNAPLPQGGPPPRLQSTFRAYPPAHVPIAHNQTLAQRDKHTFLVRCKGCQDNQHKLTLEVFEPGLVEHKIDGGSGWWTLVVLNIVAEIAGAEPSEFDAEPDENKPVVDVLAGAMVATTQVIEHTDERVYIGTEFKVKYTPFIKIAFKVDLYGLIIDTIISGVVPGGKAFVAGGGARAARKASKMDWFKKGWDWTKKKGEEIKQAGMDKLYGLQNDIFDFMDEMNKIFGDGSVIDEGRRERARQFLREHLAEMGQMMSDVNPFQFPDIKLEGDYYVELNIDACARSPSPSEKEATFRGEVTGKLACKADAAAKQRFGISILRVPCECHVKYSGEAPVARDMYLERDGRDFKIGIVAGESECTFKLDVWVLCGTSMLVDIPPNTLKTTLKTPRLQLFPERKIIGS